jgi:selT/selW/selH-like putative selenoprotein
LVPGVAGVFDVTVDGRLAYSKKQTGRFPTDEEIEAIGAAG